MEINDKLAQLENEVKVLKNEVQAVLLDLRENCLATENPFNVAQSPATTQQIIIERQPAANEPADKEPRNPAKYVETQQKEQEFTGVTDDNEVEPEIAHEEVKRAQPPELSSHHSAQPKSKCVSQKIDSVIISGLAHWADESTKRLGRERAQVVLDIAEMMGYLPTDLKQVMIKLVNIQGENSDNITARDYLDSLMKITTLLGKNNEAEALMVSILSEEHDHR
jgi:hypothetical protein